MARGAPTVSPHVTPISASHTGTFDVAHYGALQANSNRLTSCLKPSLEMKVRRGRSFDFYDRRIRRQR